MSRRKPTTDVCHCSHTYSDHIWGFLGEMEPCDIAGCKCPGFLADGLAPDPDRDDREMAQ